MTQATNRWFRLVEALKSVDGVDLLPWGIWSFAGPLYQFVPRSNGVGIPALKCARLVRSYDVRALCTRMPSLPRYEAALAVVVVAVTLNHRPRPIVFPVFDSTSRSLVDCWWRSQRTTLKTLRPLSYDGGKTTGVRAVGPGNNVQLGEDHTLDYVERRALFALDSRLPLDAPVHGFPRSRQRQPRQ